MTNTPNISAPYRTNNPFDDSAAERLRRMGLLTDSGQPDRDAVTVMARVYAGLFFDDLWDFHQDIGQLHADLETLLEDVEHVAACQRFRLICLQHDAIFHPMPDPAWWLSGQTELAELFSDAFIAHLRRLNQDGSVRE